MIKLMLTSQKTVKWSKHFKDTSDGSSDGQRTREGDIS